MVEEFRFRDALDTAFVMRLVHRRRFTEDTTDTGNTVYTALTPASYDDLGGSNALSAWTSSLSADTSSLPTAVGRIPLQDGVSATGEATCTLAIPVAAGFDLVPEVTLIYNSQSGNGVAGYGWHIGGLPVISVMNKNPYYHGAWKAARQSDTTAVWALDGMPLVRNDDPATSVAWPLRTARGNTLVKAVRSNAGVLSYFQAAMPDGKTATFGYGLGYTRTMSEYPITEMSDRNGNRITFEYLHASDGGEDRYIQTINYGYGSDGTAEANIYFTYEERTDKVTQYRAGDTHTHALRLAEISSYGSSCLAEYCFTYEYKQKDDMSFLTGIECVSRDGDSLPPTTFSYVTDGKEGIPYSLEREYGKSIAGDVEDLGYGFRHTRGKYFAGKSSEGVVTYAAQSSYKLKGQTQQYRIYGSGYSGDEPMVIVPHSDDTGYSTLMAGYGFITLESVDVDGDGADELVRVNYKNTTLSQAETILTVSVYRVQAGNVTPALLRSFDITLAAGFREALTGTLGNFNPMPVDAYFGDFDGDGRVEMAVVTGSKDGNGQSHISRLAMVDLNAGVKIMEQAFTDHPVNWDGSVENHRIMAYDDDSSGDTELVVFDGTNAQGHVYGYSSTQNQFTIKSYVNILTSGAWNKGGPYVADLNGDGYMDFVTVESNGSLKSYLWTGDWYYPRVMEGMTVGNGEALYLADVDRDGLMDALVRDASGWLRIGLNRNGESFHSGDVRQTYIGYSADLVPFQLMDMYGTGGVIGIEGRSLVKYGFTRDRSLLRNLRSSHDGLGTFKTFGYRNMQATGEDAVYAEESGQPYSLQDGFYKCSFPMTLVSASSSKGAGVLTENSSYTYTDAAWNTRGLGFCGFKGLDVEDAVSGLVTRAVMDPEKFGVTVQETVRLSSDESLVKHAYYTYDSHSTAYGKLDPRLTAVQAVDDLTGVNVQTVYGAYDAYGYPQTVDIWRRVGGGDALTEQQTLSYGHSFTGRYILGAVTQSVSAKGSFAVRTETDYDSLKRPVRIRTYKGTGGASSSTWFPVSDKITSYTANGKPSSVKEASYGATTYNETVYTYDAQGRYVATVTDPLGKTTSYGDYDAFGNPGRETDWLGHDTWYTYNAWGTLTQAVHPDGTVESLSRMWSPSGEPGTFKVTRTVTGQPMELEWFDALGREVRRAQKRFDGSLQYVSTVYDQRGLVYRESLPYKSGAVQWNTYTYDFYGRPVQMLEVDGHKKLWSYSGTSTTTTENGISSTCVTDAEGNVVSVTDGGGSIAYALRRDGQPQSVSVTPAGGGQAVVTSFQYDAFGRRTAIIDPSAGTRTDSYTNNTDGSSSIAHTGPEGTVSTSYDRFGRVTGIIRPQFCTSYIYGTNLSSSSYGQLLSEASTNGTSRNCTYDTFGRVASETEYADASHWLSRTYSYGAGSRVASVSYATQAGTITTEQYGYSNGHNTMMQLPDGRVVFSLTAENDLGQPTGVTTGGVERSYGYTSTGLASYRRIRKANTAGYLQDFSYTYNAQNQNMTSRTDAIMESTESFQYDSQNRLTSAMQSWVSSESGTGIPMGFEYGTAYTSYDGRGNVMRRSHDGLFDWYGEYSNATDPYKLSGTDWMQSSGDANTNYGAVSITSFDRPASVAHATGMGDGIVFTYGSDGERVKMDLDAPEEGYQISRWHLGGVYEKDEYPSGSGETDVERLWLGGSAYSAPMAYIKRGGGAWTLYNIGRDVHGSITEVMDYDGNVLEQYRYDPWGVQMCADTLSVPADTLVLAPLLTRAGRSKYVGSRGWCGHEHLYGYGLINMNARIYDPMTGRFLSPDPLIQDPASTANFNRYAYCLNNPLKYTDPSGKVIWEFAVFVGHIAGMINLITNSKAISNSNNYYDFVKYYAVGFAAGAASSVVAGAATYGSLGMGFCGGGANAAASSFTQSFILGCGNSLISGIGDPIMTGMKYGAAGALTGFVLGGLSAGINAVKHGGSFWTGNGYTSDYLLPEDYKRGSYGNVEYSNESAKAFSNKYFSKQECYVRNLYADGTMPKDYYRDDFGFVYNKDNEIVMGSAINNGSLGADVYLYDVAFDTPEILYTTMGHEYAHAYFYYNKAVGDMHYLIYDWQNQQTEALKRHRLPRHVFDKNNQLYKVFPILYHL